MVINILNTNRTFVTVGHFRRSILITPCTELLAFQLKLKLINFSWIPNSRVHKLSEEIENVKEKKGDEICNK